MLPSWKNPWREELNALFLPLSLVRPPALRRSNRADYLFATDLPSFASPEACQAFRESAKQFGWELEAFSGWFHLRKPDPLVPPGWFPPEPEDEDKCLRELLQRHPSGEQPEYEIIYSLLKAREEGGESWERSCRVLHREFARRLRVKERLPFLPLETP